MDFNLTEDQQAFADAARQFAHQLNSLLNASQMGPRAYLPQRHVIKAAGELGFCGLYTRQRKRAGWGSASVWTRAIIFEQLATGLHRHNRHDDNS